MILTDQDYAIVKKHLKVIEGAVKNSSASNISAELRDTVARIMRLNGFKGCTYCNSQLYLSLCRTYDYYLRDTRERSAKKITKKKSGEEKTK